MFLTFDSTVNVWLFNNKYPTLLRSIPNQMYFILPFAAAEDSFERAANDSLPRQRKQNKWEIIDIVKEVCSAINKFYYE